MNIIDFISHVDWKNFAKTIKDFILPITSLVFSSFAFYISYADRKNKKFNLKLDFFTECEEWLIDRESDTEPDVYHQNKFRIIDSVLLTNNSSLPITIVEFSISEIEEPLTAFTRIGDEYSVTVKSPYKNLPNGGRSFSGETLKKVANLTKFPPLPLPISIPPYESKITTLVFRYDESLAQKNISINIRTSRGIAKFNRFVSSSHISQLDTDYIPPQLDGFD